MGWRRGVVCPCSFGGGRWGDVWDIPVFLFLFCGICGNGDVDVGVVVWLRWHWGMCIYMKIIVVLQRLIVQFAPLRLIRTLLKSTSLSSGDINTYTESNNRALTRRRVYSFPPTSSLLVRTLLKSISLSSCAHMQMDMNMESNNRALTRRHVYNSPPHLKLIRTLLKSISLSIRDIAHVHIQEITIVPLHVVIYTISPPTLSLFERS